MYFWKTQAAVAELKANTIGQESIKNHYLAISVLFLLSYYVAMLGPYEDHIAMAFEGAANLIITVLGLNAVFSANGGASGSRFLEKIVVISIPLLVKMIVLSILLSIVVIAVVESVGDYETHGEWAFVFLTIAIEAFFYWRLMVHVKATNN